MTVDNATIGATIGATIHQLGAAWDAREITLADAVTQLRATDPSLTQQGATAQIRAWRSAVSRYSLPVGLDTASRREGRSLTPAQQLRQPIVFRFPAAASEQGAA